MNRAKLKRLYDRIDDTRPADTDSIHMAASEMREIKSAVKEALLTIMEFEDVPKQIHDIRSRLIKVDE